jgi:hypothetical protein
MSQAREIDSSPHRRKTIGDCLSNHHVRGELARALMSGV